MPDFDVAYDRLMYWELDPHNPDKIITDGGGLTKYGISHNAFPSLNIASLNAEAAKEITRKNYWAYSVWNLPTAPIPQPLANKLLNIAFNLGAATAVDFMRTFKIYCGCEFPGQADPLILDLRPDEIAPCMHYLCGMQMSRYIKDYHGLYHVPSNTRLRALDVK